MSGGEDTRARRLETHRRYNISDKGQARNLAYEQRHPERKLRWEPARNALRSGPGTRPRNGPSSGPEPGPETAG